MRGQPGNFIFIIFIFAFLIDLYSYRGISTLISSSGGRYRLVIPFLFWSVTLILTIWLIWMYFSFSKFSYQEIYRNVTFFMGFFILFYVPKLFFVTFQFIRDIILVLAKAISLLLPKNSSLSENAVMISRSDFLLQLGIVIASIPFLSIIWGIWKGKYNFRVKKIDLHFTHLPGSFNGLRIVQISDLHLGSFTGHPHRLEPAIELVNELIPDYIFFTGDLVNNMAQEAEEFIPLLNKLNARHGKYSILGNHDYGDYLEWPSESAKKENLERLFELHKEAGFTLLNNDSVLLERNLEKIALIGVENWGLPPFPQHGNLKKAIYPVKDIPFKILLSHDPSHWDAEVLTSTNVDLTLSGHTHGMQFAFSIPGWRWSPVKFKYPRWAGLYHEKNQYLYVNIGLGFIGFPGRVGTPPEISLFTLSG
jgi:predicted MPP superfamily phosphohydrolase